MVCEHTYHFVPVPCYKSLDTSCEHSILSEKTDTSRYAVKGLNPGSHFIRTCRLSMIVWVNVVLNRTVVVDCD